MTEFRVAEFSDVHLGHPRTSTANTILGLDAAFPDNDETAKLDMIIIAGDLTDRQLKLAGLSSYQMKTWIARFLRQCKRNDTVLRVLEGTPSHDWEQNGLFEHINEVSGIGCDVRWFKTVDIEYIERFNIHVLYVPDEFKPTADETWVEVTKTLDRYNLSQVDFAVMHGGFTHQYPPHLRHMPVLHDPVRYTSIVKVQIFIGHIHQMSHDGIILAAGSFDRGSHGDEGAKGHFRVTYTGDHREINFIKNPYALRYDTIDVQGLDADDVISTINQKINGLPDGSYVRVLGSKGSTAQSSTDEFATCYPAFKWSYESRGAVSVAEVFMARDKPIARHCLTVDALPTLLMSRIQSRYPDHVSGCQRLLTEVLEDINV